MKKALLVLMAMFFPVVLGGCSSMDLGKGSSMATGSASNAGAAGESKDLVKCKAPVATIEVDEGNSEPTAPPGAASYVVMAQQFGLPSDPKPLARLMLAQTGCFKVVDRAAGLRAAKREQDLKDAGFTRQGSSVKKGSVVEAQYTIVPQVMFSESNAGGGAALGVLASSFFPMGGMVAGAVAGQMRFKEAQVMLTVINNETLVQESIITGSAKSTDIGAGAALLGGLGGAGGGGFSNTNEGKVVAAAFLDAVNKLVPTVEHLQVPQATKQAEKAPVSPIVQPQSQVTPSAPSVSATTDTTAKPQEKPLKPVKAPKKAPPASASQPAKQM